MQDLSDWIDYLLWKNFKDTKPSFKEIFEIIKKDSDYSRFMAKYPQINSKTKNGQTRLAHFIKTKITRTDYQGKMSNFGSIGESN